MFDDLKNYIDEKEREYNNLKIENKKLIDKVEQLTFELNEINYYYNNLKNKLEIDNNFFPFSE